MIALCGQPFDQVTGMYTGAVRGHEITTIKTEVLEWFGIWGRH